MKVNLLFKNKTLFLLFLISTFISSCVKEGDFDFDKMVKNQYDPVFAAPFVNSRLYLQDILKDTSGIVQVNTDNTLKLVYSSKNLVSIMAKDLFEIPNQSVETDTSNMALFAPIGDSNYYSITKPYSFELPKPGQRLDSCFIKNGKLKLKINTDINHSGRITLTIPNIKYPNGNVLKVEIPIQYTNQSIPYVVEIPDIDLSGCAIKFGNAPGQNNELVFKYEHWLYKDGNPYNNPYFIQLNDSIVNISYNKLFGYIGQYDFPLGDTTDINVFNTQLAGQFELNNVKVGINLKNSYGLPIQIKVDKIQAQNGNSVVNVTDFPATNPFDINYPDINQVGQSVSTIIPMTQSFHLANAVNISPKRIIYQVSGKSNPTNNPNIQNFVLDTSKFDVGIEVELPMEGKVGGFVLQDTLAFELSKINEIKEISFRINTNNAFPLDANLQVYFTDILYNVLDSLITTGGEVIKSGIVNPVTQLVVTPTSKLTLVDVPRNRLDKIAIAKKMIIRAKLVSYNYDGNQVVKITNNDYIDIKMAMKAKLNINQ